MTERWVVAIRSTDESRTSFLAYLRDQMAFHRREAAEIASSFDVVLTHRGALMALQHLERQLLQEEKEHGQRARFDRLAGRPTG